MKIGFLDFGAVLPGNSIDTVVNNTIEYAKAADEAGFSRYWLAEHHAGNSAWAGPEIMMGLLARETENIRIGSAGVLLNLYSPSKVAEDFKMLEGLAKGRIDLGVGQGVVKEEKLKEFIGNEVITNESYEKKVKQLISNFSEDQIPEMWILGSGDFNVWLAAEAGSAFAYSLFIKDRPNDPEKIRVYKEQFKPSSFLSEPKCNVTVAGVCAETMGKANELAGRYPNDFVDVKVVGTPEICKEKLEKIADEYGTDEIIFLDAAIEHEDRMNTIRLLADII